MMFCGKKEPSPHLTPYFLQHKLPLGLGECRKARTFYAVLCAGSDLLLNQSLQND